MLKKISVVLVFFCLMSFEILFTQDENENQFGGGKVSFNAEVYTYLERVQGFIDTQKYQDAVALFKMISEKYSDEMIEIKSGLYYPIQSDIQERIKKLPIQAYELYMTEVNSIAKSYYEKGSNGDVQFWKELIDKYFISDYSGKACEKYADYLIDLGMYSLAIRYYDLALIGSNRSLSEKKWYSNKIYAYAMSGQLTRAKTLLSQMAEKKVGISLQPLLQKVIANKETLKHKNNESKDPLFLAGETMQTWVDLFTIPFDLVPIKNNNHYAQMRVGRKNVVDDDFENEVEEDVDFIRNEWLTNSWFPVQQVCIKENTYIYKSKDKLFCFDVNSNEKKWEVTLDLDTKNKNVHSYYSSYPRGAEKKRMPNSELEILNFSDQIGSQLEIINNIAFTIIGHEKTGSVSGTNNRFWSRSNQNNLPGNMLYGVDPASGKKVFRLGHSSNKEEHFRNVVFLSLPISVPNERYGVIYNKGSELYISLVDKRGKSIWSKSLCSYEDSYYMYTNNAKCVYENGYFYISTGFGLISKIEAETGKYTWASKYTRFIESVERNAYAMYLSEKPGMETNTLIVKNGVVFVAPPDAKKILGFDSESGEVLFSTNENEFSDYCRYVIGFQPDGILSCGENGVRKYNYDNLTEIWTSEITTIQARPIISDNSVIVPSGNNLYVLNGLTGVKLKKFKLSQSDENFTVGNIYAINELILSVGFDGLMICGKLSSRIDLLTEKITKENDIPSVLYRGDLYFKLNDFKNAVSDYFTYLEKVKDESEVFSVKQKIIDSLFKAGSSDNDQLIANNIKRVETLGFGEEANCLYSFLLRKDLLKKDYRNLNHMCEIIFKNLDSNKSRLLPYQNGSNFSPWLYALHLLFDTARSDKNVKSSLETFLLSKSDKFNMSFLINVLDLNEDVGLSEKLINKYFASLNGNYWNAKEAIFYRYLKRSNHPDFRTIGEYLSGILLLEIGSFGEFSRNSQTFMNASKRIPAWFEFSILPIRITEDFVASINSLNEVYIPSIKTITNPPLVEQYSFGDSLGSNILKIGTLPVVDRSEFLEKNIFYFNTQKNDLVCVDLLSGKNLWVSNFDLSNTVIEEDGDEEVMVGIQLNSNYSDGNFGDLDMGKKSHDVASVLFGGYIYAIDLISGKKVHKIKLDEGEYHLNMSEEFSLVLNGKTNELFAYSISDGVLAWSRRLTESIGALKVISNKLVVMDEALKKVAILDLKTGGMIVEKELPEAIDNFFHLEENQMVYISRGKLKACDLQTLKPLWTLNHNVYYNRNFGDNTFLPFQFTKTNYFVRTNLGELLKIDKITGSVEWTLKLPVKSNEYFANFFVSSDTETIFVDTSKYSPRTYPFSNYAYIYSIKDGELLNSFEFLVENSKDFQAKRRNMFISEYGIRGDVIPDLRKDGNNLTMTFIRKRDGVKSNAFELKINNFNSFQKAFFKGPILFFKSMKKVVAYGNKEELDLIKTVTEDIKVKYTSLKSNP